MAAGSRNVSGRVSEESTALEPVGLRAENSNVSGRVSPIAFLAGAGGAGGVNVHYHTVTDAEITAKGFQLAPHPADPANFALANAAAASFDIPGVDFAIGVGSFLSWNGYNMDGVVAAGDTLIMFY